MAERRGCRWRPMIVAVSWRADSDGRGESRSSRCHERKASGVLRKAPSGCAIVFGPPSVLLELLEGYGLKAAVEHVKRDWAGLVFSDLTGGEIGLANSSLLTGLVQPGFMRERKVSHEKVLCVLARRGRAVRVQCDGRDVGFRGY